MFLNNDTPRKICGSSQIFEYGEMVCYLTMKTNTLHMCIAPNLLSVLALLNYWQVYWPTNQWDQLLFSVSERASRKEKKKQLYHTHDYRRKCSITKEENLKAFSVLHFMFIYIYSYILYLHIYIFIYFIFSVFYF